MVDPMTGAELLAELPPAHLVIIGGYDRSGIRQIFRFGVGVTIIAGGRVAGREYEDVFAMHADTLTNDDTLTNKGVDVVYGPPTGVGPTADESMLELGVQTG
jgi:hypothetical protein